MKELYEIKYEYISNIYDCNKVDVKWSKQVFVTANKNLFLSKLNECKNSIQCRNVKSNIIKYNNQLKNMNTNKYLM